MTVAQLMSKLRKMPQGADVKLELYDDRCGEHFGNPAEVESKKIFFAKGDYVTIVVIKNHYQPSKY